MRARRSRLIVEGFHARFVVTQLAWFAMLLVVLAGLLFSPAIAQLQSEDPARQQASAEQFLMLHHVVWPSFAGVLAAAAAVVIAMTHRVAGPLYRFRRVFQDVSDGRLNIRVTLRRGDYLTQEAEQIDQMVSQVRTRVRDAQAAVDEATESLGRISRFGWLPSPEELQRTHQAIERAREVLGTFQTDEPGGKPDAPAAPEEAPPGQVPGADREAGFTLIETLLACAMIGILAALAVPRYTSALESARIAKGIGDIRTVSNELLATRVMQSCFPSLTEAGFGALLDPWGRKYVLGVIELPGGRGGKGSCASCTGQCIKQGDTRKDGRLVPINSDFDLYSLGKDGKTTGPLTAKASQDDVVRANNGGFIGLARDY